MKRRLASFLIAAVLVLPTVYSNAAGEGGSALGRDLAELLEMQLADAQRENVRLKAELDKQAVALKSMKPQDPGTSSQEALLKLEEENALLKAELTKLDQDLQALAKSRDAMSGQLDATRKELKRAASARAGVEGDGKTGEELQARCRNLEDENTILKQEVDEQKKRAAEAEAARREAKADFDRLFAEDGTGRAKHDALTREIDALKQKVSAAEAETAKAREALADVKSKAIDEQRAKVLASQVEEMKGIETQRKEALDDLFKQLASVKAELKARDAKIESLQSEIDTGREALRSQESEARAGADRVKEMQAAVDSMEAKTLELTSKLRDAEATIARKEDDIRSEAAARQATEARLDRIKLTDDQRKKTMDDVLTRLATADKLAAERGDRITVLERQLEEATTKSASTVGNLEKQSGALQQEVTRLESELKLAVDAKAAVAARVEEHEAAAQRDAARLVELEANLARITATDSQRKKAMDKLLLEIAALENEQGGLRDDLTAAHKEVATLKALSKTQSPDVSPDVTAELARLEEDNARLRRQVSALESRTPGTAAPVMSSDSDDNAQLLALERTEWEKTKADLEDEVAALQQSSMKQASMVGSLKADLAEAEQAKTILAGKVKELEDRKVDVRSSDLFQEMEKVNVTLREKLVQVEAERQRLAKAIKKLEDRDERFDDDIAHEEDLRKKAEVELADARSREVEYQELIEKLTTQVPALEQQVAALEDAGTKLQEELVDRQEDLQALKVELEKREHRLIKAERVAEVLESAREDVLHASDREKLDMHYNMAAVYAREGKFDEAEQEYLHALQLDPTDADVHYNLGILYDDELKSPAKAVVHYRRYLKLNPHGPDADQVRDWLMKLEMKMKR
jgi:chromosome segregation ATPase